MIAIMNWCHRLPGRVPESLFLVVSKEKIATHSTKNEKSIRNDTGKIFLYWNRWPHEVPCNPMPLWFWQLLLIWHILHHQASPVFLTKYLQKDVSIDNYRFVIKKKKKDQLCLIVVFEIKTLLSLIHFPKVMVHLGCYSLILKSGVRIGWLW